MTLELFCEKAGVDDEILYMQVFGLLHQGKSEKEGNETRRICCFKT